MTATELLSFMRRYPWAVQASISASGSGPGSGRGHRRDGRLRGFFDRGDQRRKLDNLRRNPSIALVIGGMTEGEERSVQCEGVVDEPSGNQLRRLKQLCLEAFPDGRERQQSQPGNNYIRVRPTRVRYSDFNVDPPETIEFNRAGIGLR